MPKLKKYDQNIKEQPSGITRSVTSRKSPKEMKSAEKMEEDDVVKEPRAKRKKSIPRKNTRKRQRMEEDAEKETQRTFRHQTKIRVFQ
ncbi:hypothetical protein Tco_0951934 [Tanacetum coccineum]|uniref:Uncharacterized protein n=1 Tax=Tanacetum coccineum TaxID=301880 RepID=A0ABQ5DWH0_9ASTR